ncbi:relaxase/mobilization nuclease domain-containing protein [Luteipulveratus halotolerans]|nr:relaxase/mobilization nuclease domain-containing protein [Luteipulveratus halotolerans]
MSGATRYLYSDGKANEHTDQHMIAGSPGLVAEWGGYLDPVEAAELGRVIEASWRAQYVDQRAYAGAPGGGVSRESLHSSQASEREQVHVYHVTMSLDPSEGEYTDEQWATLAQEFVQGMGFETGRAEDSARWAAMRHGKSAKGNDHIHLLVNLVRNNGERVELSYTDPETGRAMRDMPYTQVLRRQMEDKHDFVVPLRDRGLDAKGRGASKYTRAEQRRGADRGAVPKGKGKGPVDPDRVYLQRVVRGAAQASRTEAEWVYNVLDAGIDIEPRWAPGGRDEVTGYSVQLDKPTAPDKSAGADSRVRFAGSKLAPDLSLTQLRKRWAANETDESRAAAITTWRGENMPPEHKPGTLNATPDLERAAAELSQWNDDLERLDPYDPIAWKVQTAHAAGTVSLIAARAGEDEVLRPLSDMADRYTRSSLAQPYDAERTPSYVKAQHVALAARHLNLALRAGGVDSSRGWLAVLQQMERTARAIEAARDAHQRTNLARAELSATRVAPATLTPVIEHLDRSVATDEQQQNRRTAQAARSVLAPRRGPVTAHRPTSTAHAPERDRSVERGQGPDSGR